MKRFKVYDFDIEYGDGDGLTVTRSITVASTSKREAEQSLYEALDFRAVTIETKQGYNFDCDTSNTTYKYHGINKDLDPGDAEIQ